MPARPYAASRAHGSAAPWHSPPLARSADTGPKRRRSAARATKAGDPRWRPARLGHVRPARVEDVNNLRVGACQMARESVLRLQV